MFKKGLVLFLILIILVAAGVLIAPYVRSLISGQPLTEVENVENSPKLHPFVTEQRANILYELDKKQQDLLMATVHHYCVKEYDANSCIHHLITCGNPCLIAVPRPHRKRIRLDYDRLRKERGLPPLPPSPNADGQVAE